MDFESGDPDIGRLLWFGTTLHGWIYRAASGTALYRVVPIDDAPLQWRHGVKERVGADPAEGVLFPCAVAQHGDWFSIRYEPERPVTSLAQVLAAVPPPQVRTPRLHEAVQRFWEERAGFDTTFFAAAAALRPDSPALRVVMVGWAIQAIALWRRHSAVLLPMPAEIVFDSFGRPFHLWTPYPGLPRAEQLLTEPERVLYLAPELMGARGAAAWNDNSWFRADSYAFGVMLMQCFFRLAAPVPATKAIARAANGTLFDEARRRGPMPSWLQHAPATKDALELAFRMADPDPSRRPLTDPHRLGDALEAFGLRLSPAAAVYELANGDRAPAALDLLRTVLVSDETYQDLVMAAETARSVERPLEALDLATRAIDLQPTEASARRVRFDLLAATGRHPELMQVARTEGPRLDALVWDDFRTLPQPDQQTREVEFAKYLLWRMDHDTATRFVRERLFDGDGNYRWTYLPMSIVYGQILCRLATQAVDEGAPEGPERVAQLHSHLESCRTAIRELHRRKAMPPGEIHTNGAQLEALDLACFALRMRIRASTAASAGTAGSDVASPAEPSAPFTDPGELSDTRGKG